MPLPPALSAAMSSVPAKASAHPASTRLVGTNPARLARRGVSRLLAWMRKLARVAVVSVKPNVCRRSSSREGQGQYQGLVLVANSKVAREAAARQHAMQGQSENGALLI